MAEAVSEGCRVSSDLLDAFLKTREEPIEDLVETIRKIADARQFSQKLTDADCVELSGRAGGKSRAKTWSAPANRDGTVCGDIAGNSSLFFSANKASTNACLFLFVADEHVI